MFFSQEVEEQSHSNQEILRLTYIHPKTCRDENVIQNLRQKEGGLDEGGGGERTTGGGGRREEIFRKKLFQNFFFWQVMNNGVDDRKKGR